MFSPDDFGASQKARKQPAWTGHAAQSDSWPGGMDASPSGGSVIEKPWARQGEQLRLREGTRNPWVGWRLREETQPTSPNYVAGLVSSWLIGWSGGVWFDTRPWHFNGSIHSGECPGSFFRVVHLSIHLVAYSKIDAHPHAFLMNEVQDCTSARKENMPCQLGMAQEWNLMCSICFVFFGNWRIGSSAPRNL